jgi:hypothetical protein
MTTGIIQGALTMPFKKTIIVIVAGCFVAVLIQFIPVQKSNPPVIAEISAPEEVSRILKRSCYDCHSNETRWPWYSKIAPVSWLVVSDVSDGREHMNFSYWKNLSTDQQDVLKANIRKEIAADEMPLFIYKLGHPDAKLSENEKEIIQQWADKKGN